MTTGGALAGKVALVTGGGTGIGRAICERFAREGARVTVAGRRRGPIEEVAARLGGLAAAVDVRNEADVRKLLAATRERWGGLDVLVNNAGIPGPIANAEDIDAAALDEALAVNVRGLLLCIKHAAPLLRARGGGAIVNMSSRLGLRGYPMRAAYTATKFAVIGITQSVAAELGPHNIRVNALCPGAVAGELMDAVVARRAAAEGRPPEEIIRASYTDVAALRRWVTEEEVAEAALFLASDASRSVTATHLVVDAGRTD
jgi:NAD(P)-dependent dehydrogenase (short-subunit alcohol dehydrogenase family)